MRRAETGFMPTGRGSTDPVVHGVATSLARTYTGLVEAALPERLAELVRLLREREAGQAAGRAEGGAAPGPAQPTRIVVVAEADPVLRELVVALLEESVLDVVACASAEEAVAQIDAPPPQIAQLFTHVRLAGAMDGVQLACLASRAWPDIRLVVTSGGAGDRLGDLPGQAVYLEKPWRALDVLVQVDQAVRHLDPPPPAA